MVHTFEQREPYKSHLQSSTHVVSLETHTAVKHEDSSTLSSFFFFFIDSSLIPRGLLRITLIFA